MRSFWFLKLPMEMCAVLSVLLAAQNLRNSVEVLLNFQWLKKSIQFRWESKLNYFMSTNFSFSHLLLEQCIYKLQGFQFYFTNFYEPTVL